MGRRGLLSPRRIRGSHQSAERLATSAVETAAVEGLIVNGDLTTALETIGKRIEKFTRPRVTANLLNKLLARNIELRVLAPDDELVTISWLANSMATIGQLAEAHIILDEALTRHAAEADDDQDKIASARELALLLTATGRKSEAAELARSSSRAAEMQLPQHVPQGNGYARPKWPVRNAEGASCRPTRFHHLINADKVFGIPKGTRIGGRRKVMFAAPDSSP
jgi:hypothetical protein